VRGTKHIAPLLVLTVIVTVATFATILFIDWMPEARSEQADRVNALLWFLVISSGLIMVLVTVVLLYAAYAFRAKPGDESDGPPNHGNTRLEIAWTVFPVILLAIMGVWAFIVLDQNEELDPDPVEIEVQAAQFAWTFRYPDAGIQTGDLRVPDGRQIILRMRAEDVIHSFYVPEWQVKQDVVPGITTRVIVDTKGIGTYPVICAELCGVGHGTMRARAVVMPQAEYDAWLADASRQVQAQADAPATP
jgi:cytochrome c oxidase subunit 2